MNRLLGMVAVVGCAYGMFAEDAHVELDYVEATGWQWVDTGIAGRYDTKVESTFEWVSVEGDTTMLAARGNDGTGDNNTRINFLNNGGDAGIGMGYGAFHRNEIYLYGDKKCRMWETHRRYRMAAEFTVTNQDVNPVVQLRLVQLDDTTGAENFVLLNSHVEGLVDTGDSNLAIFGNNVAGTPTGLAEARCYGLKIWQRPEIGADYELVRDYSPVLKNGRAGFLDRVSGEVVYSASDVDLVAGPRADEPDCFLEYAEARGSAYVDLEVVGETGVSMESKMSWTVVPGDGSYVASRLGGDTRFYLYHHFNKNTIGYGYYYNGADVAAPNVVYLVKSSLLEGSQTLEINGSRSLTRSDSGNVDTGLNLYLFGCNKDGGVEYRSNARCYTLKLWKDGELVRDFLPCLKLGEVCLYDQVSRKIFRASGGQLYGPPRRVAGKPDYFVESLQVFGDNYLDTGIRARSGTRAVGDFNLTVERDGGVENELYFGVNLYHNERTILGACAADGEKRFYLFHFPGNQPWVGYNNTRAYPEYESTELDEEGVPVMERYRAGTSRHTFDVTLDQGDQTVVMDGAKIYQSFDDSVVDAGCNLYLFACNRGGTAYYRANACGYSFKIWQRPEGGGEFELVRDLRPCVKNGEAGFYDARNDEVLFLAKPVPVADAGAPIYSDDMKPAKILDYVETDGQQWIDTGVIGRSGTRAEFTMAWLDVWQASYGLDNNLDVGLLGSRTDSATDSRFYMWHTAWGALSCGYSFFRYAHKDDPAQWSTGGLTDSNILLEKGRVYHVVSDFPEGGVRITVDGEVRVDVHDPSYRLDTGLNMYLFAYNMSGTPMLNAKVRLHDMKIWQDGRLVRNFIPVRLTSGLVSLYDKVEKKIYPVKGAPFSAIGPEIGDYVDMRRTELILR